MKIKKSSIRYFFILLVTLAMTLVLASPIVIDNNNLANGTVTQNSTVELNFNITEANLKNITFSWNDTNYTLFDENLVLAYNFNNLSALGENDTHVYDISGNGNNGTTNSIEDENGRYDNSKEFNGVDTTLNYTSINLSNFTYSFWIKRKDNAGNKNIFSLTDFKSRISLSSGSILVESDSNNINMLSLSGSLALNTWNHVVLTRDLGNTTLYINGRYITSELSAESLTLTTTHIGGDIGTFMNASLDEVQIWNSSKGSSEVKQLYQSYIKNINYTSFAVKINESNITTNVLDVGIYNYFLCASNNTGSISCSSKRVIERITPISSIVANFTNSIKTVRTNFYGAIGDTFTFGNGTTNRLDTDNDGIFDKPINRTWHKDKFLDSKMTNMRIVLAINGTYLNTTDSSGVNWSKDINHDNRVESIKWAYENNLSVLLQIKRIPDWLADNSSGMCNNDLRTCPPLNYTKYANIINDTIFRHTNNMEYISIISVELKNEPYLENSDTWLSDYVVRDNITKAINYSQFFNSTYSAVKSIEPRIMIGGPSGDWENGKNMLTTFLTNVSNTDFIAYHSYPSDYLNDDLTTELNNIVGNCTMANCSYIMVTEGNTNDILTKNQTVNESRYGASIGNSYINGLNFPNQFSYLIWNWAPQYKYSNTVYYPSYPNKYHIVSEPDLDNELTIAYNVTKDFATYHSAGSTVYVSSSNSSNIKTVTTKKGNDYYITAINTGTEPEELVLDVSNGNYPYELIKNAKTGQTFNVSSGTTSLGVLDSYNILYLQAVIPPIEGLDEVCSESYSSLSGAIQLGGVILTIILVSAVLVALLLSIGGYLNIEQLDFREFTMDKVLDGVLIVGFLFLVIVTMVVLLAGSFC